MTVENPDINSEMKSIGRYVKWMFPSKNLYFARPNEEAKMDILVEFVDSLFIGRGTPNSQIDHPVVIYYRPVDFRDAVRAQEQFQQLLLTGLSKTVTTAGGDVIVKGHKNRIPMWFWPQLDTDPSPAIEDLKGYLRVREISSRIIEQDEPGFYILVTEFIAQSYRVEFDDSGLPEIKDFEIGGTVK